MKPYRFSIALATFIILFCSSCYPLSIKYISTNSFTYDKRWPCGCKALYQAGRQMGKKKIKEITRAINQAIKEKKDVTNSIVLEEIGRSAHLNLHFLMLSPSNKPIITGIITYYPQMQTAQQAREEKTAQLIKTFARSKRHFIHFICYLKYKKIKHGFLISINRKNSKKPTIHIYTDTFTQQLTKTVTKYIHWINYYYNHAQQKKSVYRSDPEISLTPEEIFNCLLQMNLSYIGPVTI